LRSVARHGRRWMRTYAAIQPSCVGCPSGFPFDGPTDDSLSLDRLGGYVFSRKDGILFQCALDLLKSQLLNPHTSPIMIYAVATSTSEKPSYSLF
jgi:hypothetical protein